MIRFVASGAGITGLATCQGTGVISYIIPFIWAYSLIRTNVYLDVASIFTDRAGREGDGIGTGFLLGSWLSAFGTPGTTKSRIRYFGATCSQPPWRLSHLQTERQQTYLRARQHGIRYLSNPVRSPSFPRECTKWTTLGTALIDIRLPAHRRDYSNAEEKGSLRDTYSACPPGSLPL